MRRQEERFNDLDVRIKIITFDADFMALAYIKSTRCPWPLLLDSDRELYQAYGMARGSWRAIYGLTSIWKYLKLIAGGQRPGKPGSDWRQMGGDVMIDPQGVVKLHYISQNPHDRPSVNKLIEVVKAIR